MKKTLILSVVLFSLCGCGNAEITSEQEMLQQAEESETETETIKYKTNLGNIYDSLITVTQENNLQWNISDVKKLNPRPLT